MSNKENPLETLKDMESKLAMIYTRADCLQLTLKDHKERLEFLKTHDHGNKIIYNDQKLIEVRNSYVYWMLFDQYRYLQIEADSILQGLKIRDLYVLNRIFTKAEMAKRVKEIEETFGVKTSDWSGKGLSPSEIVSEISKTFVEKEFALLGNLRDKHAHIHERPPEVKPIEVEAFIGILEDIMKMLNFYNNCYGQAVTKLSDVTFLVSYTTAETAADDLSLLMLHGSVNNAHADFHDDLNGNDKKFFWQLRKKFYSQPNSSSSDE